MRLQSKHPLKVKSTVIGGKMPLICLPIVAKDREDLMAQALELCALSPDLIEWRVDAYGGVADIKDCCDVLAALQKILDSIPLIFTCRTQAEGGMAEISDADRLSLILGAMETGLVDILDTELCNSPEFIDSVIAAAKASGSRVILSCHDFEKTPSMEFILGKLTEAQDRGADIAKLAAMPQGYKDVLTLMEATVAARQGQVEIPIVTISMGDRGGVSRVAGGVFGSDITFAIGKNASAPGQIPIKTLREAMSALYPDMRNG